MKKLSETRKAIIKWLCVLVLVLLIIYVFRDMAGPIWQQLKQTSPKVLLLVLAATLIYGVCESGITYVLSHQVECDMSFLEANLMTYFVSFYRVSTLGSGTIVAAVQFMRQCRVKGSMALGIYSIDYALHKLAIGVMAGALFLVRFTYMKGIFDQYNSYVVTGLLLTVVITAAIVLFACWPAFHRFLIWLLQKLDKLFKGKFTEKIEAFKEQCLMMEEASSVVLKKPLVLLEVMALNLLKFASWFSIPYIVCHKYMSMDLITSIGVTAMSVMLAAVIPMPGGIGSSEVVMTAIYSGIVGTSSAGAMALLYRFATFMVPFILGIPAAILFGKYKRYKELKNA